MPTFRRSKADGHLYVLTSLSGQVITYQLTPQGQERLEQAGLKDGDRFERGVLLALCCTGDAFTLGTGVAAPVHDERQLALDFEGDPTPESVLPSCTSCHSPSDLCLVTVHGGASPDALFVCGQCRTLRTDPVDVSIPLPLVSRSVLIRLESMGRLVRPDRTVLAYREHLDADFRKMWDDLRERKQSRQQALFPTGGDAQPRLIE